MKILLRKVTFVISIILFFQNWVVSTHKLWSLKDVDLPDSHMTRYLNSFRDEALNCEESDSCSRFHNILGTGLCWGYEENCLQHLAYSDPKCPDDHKGWVSSKAHQLKTFYEQADFGFVKQQIQTKAEICRPENPVKFFYFIGRLLWCNNHFLNHLGRFIT